QYAIEQGWDVFDIYSDDDYAGADRRRPQFNRLLRDAQQHKFDIVLCKTQSRFTRELELVEKYIHGLFPAWGIRFVSIVDNADTASKGNKKSRQINGLVNEWYLEDMSDNIRSVLDSRRENGFHIGAFALYGYQKDPKQKGRLVIDEEAAAVVREVFTLFSQGYGKTAIARLLNDRGIPNPTEYKRRHGLRYRQPTKKNSTLWKYSAIADMLENEIYIGNMVQGKYGSVSYKTKQNRPRPREQWYRVEGTHEPIIERALWEKVQALREQRVRPFAEGTVGLFSQKARCMYCGYATEGSCPIGYSRRDPAPDTRGRSLNCKRHIRLRFERKQRAALHALQHVCVRDEPGQVIRRLAAALEVCVIVKPIRELQLDLSARQRGLPCREARGSFVLIPPFDGHGQGDGLQAHLRSHHVESSAHAGLHSRCTGTAALDGPALQEPHAVFNGV
ncbi:MAG: recombinase family protein, partial [Ruthenibacterium lactatiformans]